MKRKISNKEKIFEKLGGQLSYKVSKSSPIQTVNKKTTNDFVNDFSFLLNMKKNFNFFTINRQDKPLKINTNAKKVYIKFDKDKRFNIKLSIKNLIIKNNFVTISNKLPYGWHKIIFEYKNKKPVQKTLVVAPCKQMINPKQVNKKMGLVLQLYSIRSSDSWGIGDFDNLKYIIKKTHNIGNDFIAINPINVSSYTPKHINDSPYSPTTKLFIDPIYIRPNSLVEYKKLNKTFKNKVEQIYFKAKQLNKSEYINRKIVWQHKRDTLEIIFKNTKKFDYESYLSKQDKWKQKWIMKFVEWSIKKDKSNKKTLFKTEQEKFKFFVWLVFVSDRELKNTQTYSKKNMDIGLIFDLPVGVSTESSDVYANKKLYTKSIFLVYHPIIFNQKGQNWGLSPIIPQILSDTNYKPFKIMFRNIFEKAGAIRIDHGFGFFRLWWIKKGKQNSEGLYVKYNHKDIFNILLLEAYRCKSLIIGEFLGPKENSFGPYVNKKALLNTMLLINAMKSGKTIKYMSPNELPKNTFLSLSNHDFPYTLGFLSGESVKQKHKYKTNINNYETDIKQFYKQKDALVQMLISNKLLSTKQKNNDLEIMHSMYKYLFKSKAKLVGILINDLIGDVSFQNIPGTKRKINWCIPLRNSIGENVLLNEINLVKELKNIFKN